MKPKKNCHLGVIQKNDKVTWKEGSLKLTGRVVDFADIKGRPFAVVDVLPYKAKQRRRSVPLHDLTKESQ